MFTQIQETGLLQKAGFFILGSTLTHAVFRHESLGAEAGRNERALHNGSR